MPEMHGPLFDLIERLRVNSHRTALAHYGARALSAITTPTVGRGWW